jgi:uncharacterized protein YdhG (YjbR/CyaY superfamily)
MDAVDEYIVQFPPETQQALKQVRQVIITTCPEAAEYISYAMPAYKLNGNPLVYFAGYKNHVGFYATPTGHEAFKEALSRYKQGKGSVQFPLTEPMPLELIKKIVLFRIENIEK